MYLTSLISKFFIPAGVLISTKSLLFLPIKPFPIGQHSHGKKSNLFDSQIVEGNNADERITKVRSKIEYLDLLNEWFKN